VYGIVQVVSLGFSSPDKNQVSWIRIRRKSRIRPEYDQMTWSPNGQYLVMWSKLTVITDYVLALLEHS